MQKKTRQCCVDKLRPEVLFTRPNQPVQACVEPKTGFGLLAFAPARPACLEPQNRAKHFGP